MEILNQELIQVTGFSESTAITAVICCVLAIMSFVIYLFHSGPHPYEEETKSFITIGIISLICLIVFTVTTIYLMTTGEEILEEYQQYEVTFNEKVDMNEFFDKYEVVSKNGKIFTIRDKE